MVFELLATLARCNLTSSQPVARRWWIGPGGDTVFELVGPGDPREMQYDPRRWGRYFHALLILLLVSATLAEKLSVTCDVSMSCLLGYLRSDLARICASRRSDSLESGIQPHLLSRSTSQVPA